MGEAPQTIGRYVVEGVIGRGAMGEVYRAHDPDIDRRVAIKLIRADLLDGADRAEFVARFRREAQAAGRCAHPNIVAVHDFGLHEGNPFIAMEFVDGVALSRAEGVDAVGLVLQVLAALGAAHQSGIVHRDIKPANIMLTRAGSVKVADFGISRIDTGGLTSDGMVVGTPSYMSPEQCRGEAVDARSDLFSVGVVLFEMLTGTKPFAGRSAPEIYIKLLQEEPPDLGGLRPDLPAPMRAAVMRSLAKRRDERFASAEAMASALRRAALQSAEADGTVVVPARAGREVGTGTGTFAPEVLDTVERQLAQHVGPIARYLVQSAARRSGDVDALVGAVAAHIERAEERDEFAQAVKSRAGSTGVGTAQAAAAVGAAELEAVTRALTRHLGPVAKVLVKRALPGSGSAGALWRAVAVHIESAEERAVFLRQGPP